MMTKKLFDIDPYLRECSAIVLSIDETSVLLDQTVLFAFAGGQASDSGTMNGIAIKEARITETKDILYILAQEPTFRVGETVHVVVDWQKRHKIMRNHSATHIVYEFVKEKLGLTDAIGSNVDETKGRIDYTFEEPLSSHLPEIEQKANAFCSQEQEILRHTTADGRMHWECGPMKQECCGTHVKNTKEIGTIRLKRKNIGKGKERIEIHTEP